MALFMAQAINSLETGYRRFGSPLYEKNGSSDRARTCNLLVNSQPLYH